LLDIIFELIFLDIELQRGSIWAGNNERLEVGLMQRGAEWQIFFTLNIILKW